jgi:hypothetical protein
MLHGAMSDERRFVNNPFARALHPERPRGPRGWVALALVSIAAACLFAASVVLPLLLMQGLIRHGLAQRRWGMVAVGVLMGLFYLMLIAGVARRRAR